MHAALKSIAFAGGAFVLAFAAIYLAVPSEKQAVDRLASKWADGISPKRASRDSADRLKTALKRNFLLEKDWDTTLSGVTDQDLALVIDEQPPEFWKRKPIAESAVYRIFGRLGRRDPAAAITHAVEVFQKKEIDRETGQACLRWAVSGIFENQQGPPLEPHFAECPPELWRGLIQGAIGGSDAGSVGDDLQYFKGLLTRLLEPEAYKENKSRFDELLNSVLDAWIERDPRAVITWLQSAEGKPYEGLLSKAIAAACLGSPGEMLALMTDSKLGLKPAAFAAACYRNGANEAAIAELASKMPADKRGEFLAAYAKALAEGPPGTLVDFVDAADPALLTAEVAQHLGQGIMDYAPRLFEKLTAQMTTDARKELVKNTYPRSKAREPAEYKIVAMLYLQHVGLTAQNSNPALSTLATVDFAKALELAATAPMEQRDKLVSACYSSHTRSLVWASDSLDEALNFAKSAPPELAEELRTDVVSALANKDLNKCLQTLEERFPTDVKVWQEVFLGPFGDGRYTLNIDQMNDFLQKEIKKGIDPAVYSIAAQGMVMQFAANDPADAQATVEALPDPKTKRDCTAALVKKWADTEPFAAMGYVEQLSDPDRRDAAIAALLPALEFARDKREELLALASSDEVRKALRAKMNSDATGSE